MIKRECICLSPLILCNILLKFLLWCVSCQTGSPAQLSNVSFYAARSSNRPLLTFPPLSPRLFTPATSTLPTIIINKTPPDATFSHQLQAVCQKISFPVALAAMQAESRRDTSRCVQPNVIVQETLDLPQINYASKDCLAKVLLANEEAVNIGAVLDDRDNDHYLRNPCEKAQDKFLVIRLCDRIKPTILEIANFEFFSSAPKDIRLSVGKTYPTSEWTSILEFKAQNTRDVQRFPIDVELDNFIKFIKIEILSHYGKEYYCTLSFVRLYGNPGPLGQDAANNNFINNNVNSGHTVPVTLSDEKAIVSQKSKNDQNVSHTNTAIIFMEFGKRLTALETNFKHYNQVVQSIRLLRNETRFLKQETSTLRRHVFSLQRDRDVIRRVTHKIKLENRRLKQELKTLKEELNHNATDSNLLPTKEEL